MATSSSSLSLSLSLCLHHHLHLRLRLRLRLRLDLRLGLRPCRSRRLSRLGWQGILAFPALHVLCWVHGTLPDQCEGRHE